MKRLQEAFETATKVQTDINIIYNYITNDVKLFR
jgi:hypothetical protein